MTPERSSRDAARVFGIIPAAGQSRRMGSDTPKQLLMIRGRRLLEHVIEAMLDGWLDALVVVTRSDIADELDLLEDPRFLTSLNDDPASEMIGSVRIGLQALVQALAPADADGLLVCPGDMPAVPPEVIR